MGHTIAAANPKIYLHYKDISGDANAHAINRSQELPDDTNYGDTWKQRLVGLQHMNFSISGNVDLAGVTDSDTIITGRMAVANVPLIICNDGNNVGLANPAEFGRVALAQYAPVARIGDLFKYSVTGELDDRRWVRGHVLWDPDTSITGTANGTAVQLGAVLATQNIYAAMAVIAATALTSVTVKLQSASDQAFTSPNDRITFTAFSDVTSEMPTPVAGAITDTWWRIIVSAFTGTSCQLIGAAGIATP